MTQYTHTKLEELKLKTDELMAAKQKLRHEKVFLQTVIDSLPYPLLCD